MTTPGKIVAPIILERLRLGRIGAGFPNQRDLIQPVGFRGGQQEMAKPYSQDLRDRVIDAVETG
jgi:hypothetical protein